LFHAYTWTGGINFVGVPQGCNTQRTKLSYCDYRQVLGQKQSPIICRVVGPTARASISLMLYQITRNSAPQPQYIKFLKISPQPITQDYFQTARQKLSLVSTFLEQIFTLQHNMFRLLQINKNDANKKISIN
jgi:hypothetical protein